MPNPKIPRATHIATQSTLRRIRSVTVDNGTEFHGYKDIEAAIGAAFFFAVTPPKLEGS